MIDQNLVRIVVDAGDIVPGDRVIEIGPGTGTLTEELLSRGAEVIAVEIDRDLAKLLRERFANEPRLTLIEDDALAGKHELSPALLHAIDQHSPTDQNGDKNGVVSRFYRDDQLKLVANLPYNIASPLVVELLLYGIELLAFTVQKEVADRLRAAPGSEAYGPLSVVVQTLADVEVLRTLPPQAFWPSPKIESALVRLKRNDRAGASAIAFGQFVRHIFSFRRKTLSRALMQAGYDAPRLLESTGLDAQARPEVFTPAQMLDLFHASAPAPGSSSLSSPS